MDYIEALRKIEELRALGSQPGLDRVKTLLECMGNPQDKLSFVHVAGTNGKGSVCAVVSSVLKTSGYVTGLFTSPFIVDIREQIQLDNAMISKEDFAQTAEYVFSFVDELEDKGTVITEFEFTMALAFEYFLRKGADVVVLEVGMGGLLDSTNVIKAPLCAVLTPISLDHTGFLGKSLSDIAQHKCGIIKSGTQVVSAQQEKDVQGVLEKTCRELLVPFEYAGIDEIKVIEESFKGTRCEYRGCEFVLPLLGVHQIENLSLSLGVLEILKNKGFEKITPDSLCEGVENTKNPARFEVVGENPTVIIDGAHNPEGMRTFADTAKKLLPHKKGVLLMGMLKDKDVSKALEYIEGMFSKVYTVSIDNPRTMSAEKLREKCAQVFGISEAVADVQTAFDKAYADARNTDTYLCICGSLYLASQIRPYVLCKTEYLQ